MPETLPASSRTALRDERVRVDTRRVRPRGGTCCVWYYEGMDVQDLFSSAGVDPSDFALRQVIDGLGVRVGDEAPY